ncbi:MAG: hypothetical protein A3E82_03960 [Gammaproteobacteria bacterium RIFCSPHIGHO2_12_FULL_38_11]|nr:MAG: hypothetical protein A3E82_03960 [Gammaproteobacteria bacterium RIFCSPHIGHO2_12_FULL_38_11]
MTEHSVKQNKGSQMGEKSAFKKTVLIILGVMLALLVAWHFVFPLLNISMNVTADILGVAVGSIVIICVATLLFFIFTGIGIFILGVGVFIWTILTIALFPLLFPILIPVLLLMLMVGLIAKKK